VPAAVTGLLAQFQTVADVNTNLVVIDANSIVNWPPEYVQVLNVTNWTQTARNLGNLRREETFSIDCEVRCWAGNQDPATLRNQAFLYLEQLVLQFTADPTLGGAVIVAQLVTGTFTQGVPTESGGWQALIEFAVACNAQLEQ